MTVQKDVAKNIYVGNGSTRTFPFTFECPAEHLEYIKVYLMQDDGTALATSDYQLDMDARQITYPSSGTALPEGKKLVIMRELPLQQMMNLVNNGPYFAEDIETALDESIMALQQIAEKLNRTITMSVDIDGAAFVNEVPFEAGKSFRIADDGKSIVLTEDPARVLPLAQEAYAQAQAQAQIASASAAAAAKSEDSAAAAASEAGNSAQTASTSAASAAESARLAEGYKNVAETAKSDASLYAANAKTSADNAIASKEAAQSAATTASNFASDARNSASEAKTYRDNAKNYSENVNVFVPSVSTEGVLSWTNKAGLTNPASVNIKGAKGDKGDTGAQGIQGVKGDKGDKGDTGATGAPGTAATIKVGTVTTGAAGSAASVTNSGTASNVVLDFTLPRGKDGADGGVTVDAELSDTSTNPVQNKVVKSAIDTVAANIPAKVSDLQNDAGYLTQHQPLDGYAKTSVANIWTEQQTLNDIIIDKEKYNIYYSEDGPVFTPPATSSLLVFAASYGNPTTLNLETVVASLKANEATVLTVYFLQDSLGTELPLIIQGITDLLYVGTASDIAIGAKGSLVNILILKESGGGSIGIVQASKLEGGA